jgi:hypothetical protein
VEAAFAVASAAEETTKMVTGAVLMATIIKELVRRRKRSRRPWPKMPLTNGAICSRSGWHSLTFR